MSESRIESPEMQEYFASPRRISILTQSYRLQHAVERLTDHDLMVDFKLASGYDLHRFRKGIARDGLGTLVVYGRVLMDYSNGEDITRHVPFMLSEMGVGDTPTVYIPREMTEILDPSPPDEGYYPYTEVLNITDKMAGTPGEVLDKGAELVRLLVETIHAVE